MAKKSTTGKTQTRKQPASSKTPENLSPRIAMQNLGAAVEAAKRHAEDLQSHATDGLKTAVEDVQKRQIKLQKRVADIGKKSTMSAADKVAATQKAVGDFDAFIARVGAGIDREWNALSKRASALRKDLEGLKAEAIKRTEKDYAKAEKAVKDFDKFVERNAASLEKDVLAFTDRAELQFKSMRDTIALYSAKSAEMAKAGSGGAAEIWKDLKHSQKNAQKQFSAFSKSSARAWKDIARGLDRAWSDLEKAGQKAASRYANTAKPAASGRAKKGTKAAKPPVKKPAKATAGSGPSTRPAGTSIEKAATPRKPAAKRAPTGAPAKPEKS
ncbi:MAG TPA: hypothetical protein VM325_07435 [Alphaproteobacteria bacterium]|nr:hypothetical protein [Alphaproteobacteria bacterium]